MNLKNNAVDNIIRAIMDDVKIDIYKIRDKYLESKEFAKLMKAKVEEIENLLNIVNDMADLTTEELLSKNGAWISFAELQFRYDKQTKCFVLSGFENVEHAAKWFVERELKISDDHIQGCFGRSKISYIQNKVAAMVSTMSEDVTYDRAHEAITNSIDIKSILFDKEI